MSEPTPIKFEDIKPGDKVRRLIKTDIEVAYVVTIWGVPALRTSGGAVYEADPRVDWLLLDRPKVEYVEGALYDAPDGSKFFYAARSGAIKPFLGYYSSLRYSIAEAERLGTLTRVKVPE